MSEKEKKLFVGRIDFYSNGQVSVYEKATDKTTHMLKGILNSTEAIVFQIPDTDQEIEFKLNQLRVNFFVGLFYRISSFINTNVLRRGSF